MPLYGVKCLKCGTEQDIFRSFSTYDDLPTCCGERMQRLIYASYVVDDIQPYRSMADGKWITSRSAHRNHLKAHRLIEVGDQTQHLKPKPVTPPPGLKDELIRVANDKLRSK